MHPMTLKIKVGESGKEFLQRNNLDSRDNVDRQPVGLNFHEHDWSTKNPGTVHVEHGPYSFVIPHALGVMGSENADRMEEGLYKFKVTALISTNRPTPHDEARLAFDALLQTLIQAGWKTFFLYEDPRLNGEEAFKYSLGDSTVAFPIDYSPTLDEWMTISSGHWRLYAGDLFFNVDIWRDYKRMDPQKPGAYLLSFTLYGKEQLGRTYVKSKDRDHWQTLWVDIIKGLKKERYATEKKLQRMGYTIDTSYVEPLVHPEDPVEP